MKVSKELKLNLSNYQMCTIGVSEMDSFEECNRVLREEILKNGYHVTDNVKRAVGIL